jgi:hypothetical protein
VAVAVAVVAVAPAVVAVAAWNYPRLKELALNLSHRHQGSIHLPRRHRRHRCHGRRYRYRHRASIPLPFRHRLQKVQPPHI